MRNGLAVVTALGKQVLWLRFLEVGASHFIARDLRRNGEHRNTAALAIVQPVYQVQIAGAAAPRTNSEFSCEVRFGASGECRGLLMPYMNPLNLSMPSNCVRETVERVAGKSEHRAILARHICLERYRMEAR